MPKCNRGDVLEVNLDPSAGREYMKSRPCLVVQSDMLNKYSQSRLSPDHGSENTKGGPTYVPIPKAKPGFRRTALLCAIDSELWMSRGSEKSTAGQSPKRCGR